jgi:NIMA (never in mitosis gene a)-related kinase
LDVKIGDLGVAKILSHSGCFAKTLIGTPYYLSPELCEEKPYNDKSDIWALGCILYELCTYKHPFNAKSQGGLILKILESEPEPIGNNYSNDLQKIINNIFEKKMEKRPSCQDILKNNKIIEKAKRLELYNMIEELYPELKETRNQNNQPNVIINNKMIYNKTRYPRNYKAKNNLQKNNSIGNIVISNNNIHHMINRNINIYKKK